MMITVVTNDDHDFMLLVAMDRIEIEQLQADRVWTRLCRCHFLYLSGIRHIGRSDRS